MKIGYTISLLLFFLLFFSEVVLAANTNFSQTVTKKVLVIDFNPIIESSGNVRLRDLEGWNNPEYLETQYIGDLNAASSGYLSYRVVSSIRNIDYYPVKEDGFQYTDETYLSAINNSGTEHRPDIINYLKLINDYDLCGKVNRGEIDEVWLWGGPWFGFYESIMAGPSAFFTNAPPVEGTNCQKQLQIMGFSYEAPESNMLEDFGHRTEGTMSYVFNRNIWNTNNNDNWGKYISIDKNYPGESGCGQVHFAPNSVQDYDWSNQNYVLSNCEDWLNYPNFTGDSKQVNCGTWSCGDYGHGYKKWWLSHLPKYQGWTNNIRNNWWSYVVDYENTIRMIPNFCTTCPIGVPEFKLGNANCDTKIDLADFNNWMMTYKKILLYQPVENLELKNVDINCLDEDFVRKIDLSDFMVWLSSYVKLL